MNLKILLAVAAVAAMVASGATAGNLLINGGFETGDFTGWTEVDELGGSGSWFVQAQGAGTPLNGFATPTLAGGGNYFADTDQYGGGSHALSQSFIGTAGGHYTLSFEAYADDQSGQGPLGTGVDYNNSPNQHVQVDLNGVNVYYGILTPAWASYSFDVSADVVTGGNTLTFTEVDDLSFLNEGLDNVSLTASVPEPATWSVMLLGLGVVGATLRGARRTLALA
jgi:hypothetical protein